jgi:DivIVA domain-containing protein
MKQMAKRYLRCKSALWRASIVSSVTPGERFRRHRFGAGYDVESVEAFLARAELGGVTAADVKDVVFRSVFRGGYDEQEVDAALDELAARLTADGHVGTAPPESRFRSWLTRLRDS